MAKARTARAYSSPLRAEQAEQTRERIVQAAVDLLGEGDAGDLSMGDVADARRGVGANRVPELREQGRAARRRDRLDQRPHRQRGGATPRDARRLRGDDRRRGQRAVRDRAALPRAVRHPGRARVAPAHGAHAPREPGPAPTPPSSRRSTTNRRAGSWRCCTWWRARTGRCS